MSQQETRLSALGWAESPHIEDNQLQYEAEDEESVSSERNSLDSDQEGGVPLYSPPKPGNPGVLTRTIKYDNRFKSYNRPI